MRIAYICADPGVPVFGRKGCSIHVQEVIRAFIRRGIAVDVFATRLDGEPPQDLAAVRVHQLPPAPKADLALREQQALAANDMLYALLDQVGPFDLVYERYSLWSYRGMQHGQKSNTPTVLEVNAPLIEEQADHRGLVNRQAAEDVAVQAFGAASALLAVSAQVATYLERFPVAQGRVHVVPNGVNPERFSTGLRPRNTTRFVVGFVGSLKPWHGLPVLVDAFDRFHERVGDARLLIVGDGTERERIESDLAQRGLSAAAWFTGAVDHAIVPGLLAKMDVAVAPYPLQPDFYFSPLKVYEYMAAGLPVIASQIGQLDDLIEHGQTGLLCPPGDAVALAEALHQLHNDAELRTTLGRAARNAVLHTYTWDAVANRVLELAMHSQAPKRQGSGNRQAVTHQSVAGNR